MSIERILQARLDKVVKIVNVTSDKWITEEVTKAVDQAKKEIEHEVKTLYGEVEDDFKSGGWALWITGAACLFVGLGLGLLIG